MQEQAVKQHSNDEPQSAETDPLLSSDMESIETEDSDTEYIEIYLPSLPWYSRPSMIFLIPVFFFAAVGATVTGPVSIKIMTEIICNQSHQFPDPKSCSSNKIVQEKLSHYLAINKIISGIVSLLVIPYLCSLSDRIGRKPILIALHLAVILSALVSTIGWEAQEYIDYNWNNFSAVFDGISNPIVVSNLLSAFISDCIPSAKRTQSLAQVFVGTSLGYGLGPFLGNFVYKVYGESLVAPFITKLAFTSVITILVIFMFPESLSQDVIKAQQLEYEQSKLTNPPSSFQSFFYNLLIQPYKDLIDVLNHCKTKEDRHNLINLVAIDVLFAILSYGLDSIVINHFLSQLGSSVPQIGYVLTISAIIRVVSLGVAPLIGSALATISQFIYRTNNRQGSNDSKKGIDTLHVYLPDVYLMRLANILETIGLVIVGFSHTYIVGIFGVCFIGLGVISRPSVLSATINVCPHNEIGKFMGAKGPFEIIAVLGSSLMLWMYGLFASNNSERLVFFIAAAFYSISVLISFRFR